MVDALVAQIDAAVDDFVLAKVKRGLSIERVGRHPRAAQR